MADKSEYKSTYIKNMWEMMASFYRVMGCESEAKHCERKANG